MSLSTTAVATFVFQRGTFQLRDLRRKRETEACALVSALPPAEAVPPTPIQFAHDEPIVLWRMQRQGGSLCHSVIRPRSNGALVVWFINGRPLGFRDFADWKSALRWSDQLQAQNWSTGWRPALD